MSSNIIESRETMTNSENGQILSRGVRPFIVAYKGLTQTVDLPGYYPEGDGDGIHVGTDMAVVNEALATLKARLGQRMID